MLRGLFLCLALLCLADDAPAEQIRLALFNAELDRKGPGLLLRDIVKGEDPQIAAVFELLRRAQADALVLLRVDWDADGAALSALAAGLSKAGLSYPHRLAIRPNSGRDSGADLDGDGRLRGPRDAQGYGLFTGQNGMAILSKHPIELGAVRDFSPMLWRDLPSARLPQTAEGSPFPSAEAQAVQRLSTVGHWDVPVILPGGARLHLLAFHASPPVFDGPEDANGLRNADELALWRHYLDGALPQAPPEHPIVVIGGGNVDPVRGEGRHSAIQDLLAHPRLQDPRPQSPGAHPAATVDWTGIADPAHLRVDYILPDRALEVVAAGVLWPVAEARGETLRHGLVWVDLRLP